MKKYKYEAYFINDLEEDIREKHSINLCDHKNWCIYEEFTTDRLENIAIFDLIGFIKQYASSKQEVLNILQNYANELNQVLVFSPFLDTTIGPELIKEA